MAEEVVVKLSVIDEMSSEIKAIRANMEANFSAANRKLQESKGAFGDLGSEIKSNFVSAIKGAILAYAGFQVVGKITGFLKEARIEYKEQVQLQFQLRTALGYTSLALNEQAEALGKKLIVDNEEITAVHVKLANYIKNEEQIKRLTPAVLDLAAATGMDMTSAAQMVARGIADDNGELGRFKIAIEGAKGSAERIQSVIEQVTRQMGGQAEAVSGSRDAWDALGNTWKNFQEKAGGKMTRAMNDVYIQFKFIADLFTGKDIRKSVEEIMALQNKWSGKSPVLVGPVQPPKKILTEEEKRAIEEQRKRQQEEIKIQQDASVAVLESTIIVENKKAEAIQNTENLVMASRERQNEQFKKITEETNRRAKESGEIIKKIDKENSENKSKEYANQIQMAGSLFSAIANGNRRNANEAKNIARGEAGINTAVAVTKALPNPFAVAWVLAMGLAQQIAISNAKFANGVSSYAGGMALVGENGPEYVNLPRGASVYNNTQTRNMTTNAALNVTIHDSSGNITETIRAQLRSGQGDRLVRDIQNKIARQI